MSDNIDLVLGSGSRLQYALETSVDQDQVLVHTKFRFAARLFLNNFAYLMGNALN